MNGVAMAATAALRRAVARPSAYSGVIVAAAAWIVTRIPMYQIDTGGLHDRWRLLYLGDIWTYRAWLRFFAAGGFPSADPRWQYPPGAAAVLTLPHLLPDGYTLSFLRVALLCDLAVTVVLARMAIKRGSWLGCWCWVAGIPLLGPVALGRFDVAATLFAVLALYVADSPWGLGAFGGLGAVVKVWPMVVLVGVRPRQATRAVTAAIATAGVVVGGYLAFTRGSLSFLANQGSRGLEIESVGAQPFLVLRKLGMWHGHIKWQYGSFQIVGPGVGIAADVMLGSTLLALIALGWWRWRMSWRPEVVGDAALVATLLVVTTSRVLSVQYMIWLIGIAACALAFPRTSQRPVALLLMIAVGLTQAEYPFLFNDANLLSFGTEAIVVVAVRDAVLLTATCLAFVRLWRSTGRSHSIIPDRSNGAASTENHVAGRRFASRATLPRITGRLTARPLVERAGRGAETDTVGDP
ncbi:MAG TPA: glycosyltransferase family 87 protein [Streptosporangiaceae bacterium]|nr:glycosyltransferase family 87 protein [Streptosporangiaceae bacterium]